MLPTLPQHDPRPGARRAALATARTQYRFVRAYGTDEHPEGVALAEQVPPSEEFDLRYSALVASVDARLMANHAALDLEILGRGGGFSLTDWLGLTRQVGNKHLFFQGPTKAASRMSTSFPAQLSTYDSLFRLLPRPDVIAIQNGPVSVQDQAFAWQRIAGANPMMLQAIRHVPPAGGGAWARDLAHVAEHRASAMWDWFRGRHEAASAPVPPDTLPPWFQVTDAHFQRVMGPDDSLERAAAEGRLFLADFHWMHGLPNGTWSDGALGIPRPKYVYAPMALFARPRGASREQSALVPVAIQCEQVGDAKHAPVFTPGDGHRWRMARTVVQNADGNCHEMVYHLSRAHLTMEALAVAAHRNLAPTHPLLVLLRAHLRFTLAINDYASKNLIAPGGQVDALFGSTLSGSLTAMVRSMAEFRLDEAAPDADLAKRGVLDRDVLAYYPYRDDGLLVWQAILHFVTRYVGLYYDGPEDIAADRELQGFLEALSSPDEAGLGGVPPATTPAELARLIAIFIWIGSAQHGALNYAQFPFFGYAPNTPAALYAKAPTGETPDDALAWMAMLPPIHQAVLQMTILYQLSSVHYDRLGHYPALTFIDPRVDGLVQEFQQRLRQAESEMKDNDARRFLPYPYMRPSQVGNSVYI